MKKFSLLAMLLSLAVFAGCEMQLYGDLSEKSANEILAALQEQGIIATKQPGAEGTYTVMVDEMDFQRSMRLLERLNMPRHDYQSMGTVFAKSGLVSTPTEEKARMVFALSQELTETLTRIDGVLEARVHIVMRNVSDIGQELSPASASIFLKVNEAADSDGVLIANRVSDIQRLAVNAVPDLQADRVLVTIFPTDAPIPRGDNAALRARREAEVKLYMIIGGSVVGLLLLGGALYFFVLRKKPAKKKAPPPPSDEEPAAPAAEGGEAPAEG